ncbi:MAG: hypothetical protein WA970_10035, partial [Gammaproteobacteria bacterium]
MPKNPLLFHREKTVERHNPNQPPGATLANASKRKTINDSENLAIKYRAPAHIRYRNVGSTGWIDLEDLRRLFGVDESSYYGAFKHFNNKLIKP